MADGQYPFLNPFRVDWDDGLVRHYLGITVTDDVGQLEGFLGAPLCSSNFLGRVARASWV